MCYRVWQTIGVRVCIIVVLNRSREVNLSREDDDSISEVRINEG